MTCHAHIDLPRFLFNHLRTKFRRLYEFIYIDATANAYNVRTNVSQDISVTIGTIICVYIACFCAIFNQTL